MLDDVVLLTLAAPGELFDFITLLLPAQGLNHAGMMVASPGGLDP
jgi:hypothetical protein